MSDDLFNDVIDECRRFATRAPQMSFALPVDVIPPSISGRDDPGVAVVPVLEALLAGDPLDPEPRLVTYLLAVGTDAAASETLALQVAFGSSAGEIRSAQASFDREQRRRVSLSTDEDDGGGVLAAVYRGEWTWFPDIARIKRGISVMRICAAIFPEENRPPLLCAIAWLHWARGQRALAMAYVEEAARIDPHDDVASGLSLLITVGPLPAWLASAYTGAGANAAI